MNLSPHSSSHSFRPGKQGRPSCQVQNQRLDSVLQPGRGTGKNISIASFCTLCFHVSKSVHQLSYYYIYLIYIYIIIIIKTVSVWLGYTVSKDKFRRINTFKIFYLLIQIHIYEQYIEIMYMKEYTYTYTHTLYTWYIPTFI